MKRMLKTKKVKAFSTLDPREWGDTDYSEFSSFNSAFRNAREKKEGDFIYKGKRYTTDLVDKSQSDNYYESKKFLEDYFNNNIVGDTTSQEYDATKNYLEDKYKYNYSDYWDKIEDEYMSDNLPEKRFIQINDSLDKVDALSDKNIEIKNHIFLCQKIL